MKAKPIDRDALKKELIQLAYDYLDVRENKGRPLFDADLFFILPSIKKALSLYAAIIEDVEGKRLLSGTIVSRTLIEVIVTFLFVIHVKKDEGFYKKFMQYGRLRIKRSGKGWEKVTVASQIKWVEENYGVTRLQEVYDNCSKLVHYSDKAMQLMIDRRPSNADQERMVGIVIADNEGHFPDKNFIEMLKSADGMMVILKHQLNALIKQKRSRIQEITGVEVVSNS